jgi:hypothetical protein
MGLQVEYDSDTCWSWGKGKVVEVVGRHHPLLGEGGSKEVDTR